MPEPKTIRDMVHYAITQFKEHDAYYGHGTTNSEDEAFWLILGALKLDLTQSDKYLEMPLNQKQQAMLLELIKRRAQDKIPVAYLLKEAYLRGFKFYVDETVLIPRSPIAELIENHFSPWHFTHDQELRILDLCTGSGCLAILCAHYFPKAKIDAIDISGPALKVAQKNVEDYQFTKQINLIQSDLFSAISDQKYHIIISNPPYVDAEDIRSMPKEYHQEPRLGLAAGEDGLDIVRRILKEAKQHLHANGLLIVEVGNSQIALEQAYPKLPFTWLEFADGGEGVFLLQKEDLN